MWRRSASRLLSASSCWVARNSAFTRASSRWLIARAARAAVLGRRQIADREGERFPDEQGGDRQAHDHGSRQVLEMRERYEAVGPRDHDAPARRRGELAAHPEDRRPAEEDERDLDGHDHQQVRRHERGEDRLEDQQRDARARRPRALDVPRVPPEGDAEREVRHEDHGPREPCRGGWYAGGERNRLQEGLDADHTPGHEPRDAKDRQRRGWRHCRILPDAASPPRRVTGFGSAREAAARPSRSRRRPARLRRSSRRRPRDLDRAGAQRSRRTCPRSHRVRWS